MTRNERLRRCMILCCHVARNVAYHRPRRDGAAVARQGLDFWNTADGNFVDIAVLGWCELFGRPKAEQGWQKVVTDPVKFEGDLLAALGLPEVEFADYVQRSRHYRDKFLAHLDSDLSQNIPHMDIAIASTRFLYNHIWTGEIEPSHRGDAPADLQMVYDRALAEGRLAYA